METAYWLFSIKKIKAFEFINTILNKFNLDSLSNEEYAYTNELNLFLKNEVNRKDYKEKENNKIKNNSMLKKLKNRLPYRIQKALKKYKN